jgi:DNA mismatch endonuclease Vsr
MADVFNPKERSRIMARVKNRNTKPEQIVQNVLFKLGIRYRLIYKNLPCKPDIIFPRRKKVIFVHGCFWHGHSGCKRSKLPDTNHLFWKAKIEKNIKRDEYSQDALEALGWSILIIWQCELKDIAGLKTRLQFFLNQPTMSARDRIKKFFEENVGKVVTTHDISNIAGIRDYQRRIRELRNEYGLKIRSHVDRADLKPGEYLLESLDLDPAIGRSVSLQLRNQILERNGYTCQQCGASAHDVDDLDTTKKVRLHIDHIVPLSQGGTNDPDNLRVLCSNCNHGKSNMQTLGEPAMNILAKLRKSSRAVRLEVFEALKKEFSG